MNYCAEAVLVGLDHELPSDPAVAYSGKPPIIGCNHLVCTSCGADVHHADSRSTTSNYPPAQADLVALYESSNPASSSLLDSAPRHRQSRAYVCRCDWTAVNLGGALFLEHIDQPWKCGGHHPPATEARESPVAQAQKTVAELVRAAVPVSPSGAKIRFTYAPSVNPEFATASELRDSLLTSYPDAAYFGGPLVGRGRDDTAPAWGWAVELIRTRTDWWPALGIALQHAVTNGGELAGTAFADLLAEFRDSLVLLPWTSPLAETMPDVKAQGSGTGWGLPDLRLETIVRDQRRYIDHVKATNSTVGLIGYGKSGDAISRPLTDESELRALLDETAQAGQFPDGDKGPWSWLGFELRTRDEWIRATLLQQVAQVTTLDPTNQPHVFALLDWFSEEQDLWRFEPLLADWHGNPPAWAKTAANTKPKGWKRTIRSSHWPEVQTLGDIAHQALWRAKKQLATPPVLDLPVLFGSRSRDAKS